MNPFSFKLLDLGLYSGIRIRIQGFEITLLFKNECIKFIKNAPLHFYFTFSYQKNTSFSKQFKIVQYYRDQRVALVLEIRRRNPKPIQNYLEMLDRDPCIDLSK
jgi:hypothetical protein